MFTLLPSFFRLSPLNLPLIRMLRWVKHIHRELQSNSPLHQHRQVPPYRGRHRNENACVVQIPFVLWPSSAFLIALLGSGTFLQWQPGDEHEKQGEEDPAEHAAVECCVDTSAGRDVAVGSWSDGDDEDSYV